MQSVDKYISQGNTTEALGECLREGLPHLGLLLGYLNKNKCYSAEYMGYLAELRRNVDGLTTENVVNVEPEHISEDPQKLLKEENTVKRVYMLCNWASSKELCDMWNKMSKGNYTWGNVRLVWEEPADYVVIINCPPINYFHNKNNTILFRMEPNMHLHPELWGSEWSKPNPKDFIKLCNHESEYNNNEWHLSKTYNELMNEHPVKTYNTEISTVLSDKYHDPGHVKRVDFVKFLDGKSDITVHVFGSNKYIYNNYQRPLPLRCKDDGLYPYKYTFNVENQSVRNYYTEKLIDGILSECLVFYHGCPNIRDFIDERAFVWLELKDFEHDYMLIQKAISEDWWSQRLQYIREAKKKILNYYSFFPRLERIINEHEDKIILQRKEQVGDQ